MNRSIIVVAIVVGCGLSNFAWAGSLKNFESGVSGKTPPTSSSSLSSSSSASDSSDDVTASLIGTIFDIFFISNAASQSSSSLSDGSAMPGAAPVARNMYGASLGEVNRHLRESHSFALPNIRVDALYHYAMDGVQAMRFQGTGGFLLMGADVDFTRYYEGSDRLNNFATHGLFRIPLADGVFEVDVALGYRRIWGDTKHQGFDWGFPMYLNLGQYVQLNAAMFYTYIGKKPIQDYDFGMSLKYKLGGIRAGYRYVNASGTTLKGPEVGIFFQY